MHGSDSSPQYDAPADYALLEKQVCSLLEDERDFIANAANFAAFVYFSLPQVNWAGFYFPDVDGLVLGPFGGKPACTRLPKGRGVCGRAFESRKSVIVDDVNAFADHIVCDSASRSELVVPIVQDGAIYGVFDIDSPRLARFDETDREGIERLVARFAELTPLPAQYRVDRKTVRLNDRIDVQTCRDHHSVLRYMIDDLLQPHAKAGESASLFKRFRAVLMAHLKLEDDWLYPRLAASDNAIVRGKAERYRQEMGGVRRDFEALWKRWSAEGSIERDFAGWQDEWRRFAAVLVSRIETEDGDLYVAAEADLA